MGSIRQSDFCDSSVRYKTFCDWYFFVDQAQTTRGRDSI